MGPTQNNNPGDDAKRDLEAAIAEVALLARWQEESPSLKSTVKLATGLKTLAILFSDFGYRQEALAATQQSVQLYRKLCETQPKTFSADLAGSVNKLGNELSDLGRHVEALAASEEALSLRRRLDRDHPGAFAADIAGSLWVFWETVTGDSGGS